MAGIDQDEISLEEPLGTPFFDYKRNEEILEEQKTEPVHEKLKKDKNQIGYEM